MRFMQLMPNAAYHEINGRAVVNLRPQSTCVISTDWFACGDSGFDIRGSRGLGTHCACQSNNREKRGRKHLAWENGAQGLGVEQEEQPKAALFEQKKATPCGISSSHELTLSCIIAPPQSYFPASSPHTY